MLGLVTKILPKIKQIFIHSIISNISNPIEHYLYNNIMFKVAFNVAMVASTNSL